MSLKHKLLVHTQRKKPSFFFFHIRTASNYTFRVLTRAILKLLLNLIFLNTKIVKRVNARKTHTKY